jgi:hypothetical protein
VIPERRPMDSIGAGFGNHRDLPRLTKLGIVHRTIGAQFGDGFCRRKRIRNGRVAGRVLDGDSVHGDFRLERQSALQGKRGMVRLHPRQCRDDVQSAGAGRAGAGIYRQVRCLRCRIHGADRRRVRIDRRNCVGRNLDFLLDISYGQGNVDAELLARRENNASGRPSLKPRGRHFHGIAPSLCIDELILPGAARNRRANGTFIQICERDRRTRDHRASLIRDGSDKAALDGLRHTAGASQKKYD